MLIPVLYEINLLARTNNPSAIYNLFTIIEYVFIPMKSLLSQLHLNPNIKAEESHVRRIRANSSQKQPKIYYFKDAGNC